MSWFSGTNFFILFEGDFFKPAVLPKSIHETRQPFALLPTSRPMAPNREIEIPALGNAALSNEFSVRKLIPFLAVCLLFAAAPSWATTHTAASCSASDVQAAINASVTGDVVIVPGTCSASWGTQVSIAATQGITVQASGTVTVSNDGFIIYAGNAPSRITGFTFTQGVAACNSAQTPIATRDDEGGSMASAPWRIDHNTFTSTNQVVDICVNENPGLIDNNTFNIGGASEVIHINDQGGGPSNWSDDVTPGSARMTYIETNTFNNTDNTYLCSAEESYNDGKFVFRYNNLYGCQNDIHGGSNGGRWGEIYGNTYHIGILGSLANFVQWRGGSGVYFNNHSSAVSSFTQFGPDCPSSDTCSGTWIVPKQVGAGINQTTHSPAYIWGNDSGMLPGLGVSTVPFVIGGTAPVDATHCSGHSGSVCDYVSTSTQPSTLLECQSAADVSAGCPVAHTYTPWVYPYPLDANGMPAPTGNTNQSGTPGAPTNLQGTVQ